MPHGRGSLNFEDGLFRTTLAAIFIICRLLARRAFMRTTRIAFLLVLTLIVQADLASAAPPIEQPNEKQGPSLFGTVALPISRTPLDVKWHVAFAASVSPHTGPWAPMLSQLQGASQLQKVEAVNSWVNQHVAFRRDSDTGSEEDAWSTATATLQRGTGDCEDYAIAKLQLLRALGIPDNAIYLMIGRDRVLNADHALLVVRIGHEAWTLDNRADAMPANKFAEFSPVFSFSGLRRWLHGYPSTPKPVPPTRIGLPAISTSSWLQSNR